MSSFRLGWGVDNSCPGGWSRKPPQPPTRERSRSDFGACHCPDPQAEQSNTCPVHRTVRCYRSPSLPLAQDLAMTNQRERRSSSYVTRRTLSASGGDGDGDGAVSPVGVWRVGMVGSVHPSGHHYSNRMHDTVATQRQLQTGETERQRHTTDIMQNCNQPDNLFPGVPEPEPDYHDDDSNDFPPPPSPLTLSLPHPHPNNNNDNNANVSNINITNINTSNNDNNNDNNSRGATPEVTAEAGGWSGGERMEGEGEGEGERREVRMVVIPGAVSKERQALHKELILNQKTGRDVLQKPELSKVLEQRRATQKRKEWQQQQANKRTSLELKLEKQANKLKEEDKMKPIVESDKAPEFVQIHRRITHKTTTSPPT